MLRITALSLLLGALALTIGLALFFTPAEQQTPPLRWEASSAKVLLGTPTIIDTELQLELDGAGAGLVSLAETDIEADDFSFIHLALEEPVESLHVTIVWTDAQEPQVSHSYKLENYLRQSIWLATDELRGWSGELDTLSLSFQGKADDTLVIKDFSIFPASTTYQLLAIYSDLTGYAPWNTAAMNTYTGAFNASSFYPIALAVAFLALSLAAYRLLLFMLRTRLRFSWSVVALIFLSNWVILDMLWQYRLLHQLADTHRVFSGKNTEQRLAVGPDAELYNFASSVKPLLESTNPRIFVTSDDNYSGMRTAYYFFPLNVHWSLYGPPLPHRKFLRRGDYIVLINPTNMTFDPKRSQVKAPKRRELDVELVLSAPSGTVVQLK
ncbi:Uncharacterised protein [Halioglobus japonicus]|nr:Uncharacterised protein [Halioglobus japonicus]